MSDAWNFNVGPGSKLQSEAGNVLLYFSTKNNVLTVWFFSAKVDVKFSCTHSFNVSSAAVYPVQLL